MWWVPSEGNSSTALAKYFLQVETCQNRPVYRDKVTLASLSVWGRKGGWRTGGWSAAVFRRASLTGIACAEDLVGGAEDALGETLGKRRALAP